MLRTIYLFLAVLLVILESAIAIPLGSFLETYNDQRTMDNNMAYIKAASAGTKANKSIWNQGIDEKDKPKDKTTENSEVFKKLLRDIEMNEMLASLSQVDNRGSMQELNMDTNIPADDLRSVSNKRKYRCLVNIVNCYWG